MSVMENKPVRGTYDILPDEAEKRRGFFEAARLLLENSGFRPIDTPLVEKASLFNRTSGEASDIVSKEMYRVSYSGGNHDASTPLLVLRPEGTAPVVRAYLNAFQQHGAAGRFYYHGPMFRYSRPQKGRYRQFFQLGVEIFDADSPHIDAECLSLLSGLMNLTGLEWPPLQVNTLGCRACQDSFRPRAASFFLGEGSGLCRDCLERREKNPLRVMDCPKENCRKVVERGPVLSDHLCSSCRAHFEKTLDFCRLLGVDFEVNPRLVRGLDYYTRTVFEAWEPGTRNAAAAGGRYDELVSDLGGKPTPALGFAIGLERFLGRLPGPVSERDGVRLVCLDEKGESRALEAALELMKNLRAQLSVPVTISARPGRKLKAQLGEADRDHCRFAMIIGSREIESGRLVLRDLEKGSQEEVEFARAAEVLPSGPRGKRENAPEG